jgi:hypothetical protein
MKLSIFTQQYLTDSGQTYGETDIITWRAVYTEGQVNNNCLQDNRGQNISSFQFAMEQRALKNVNN